MIETKATVVVSEPKTTPPTTPMAMPDLTTTSQDIAATLTTKTLLLLTSGPQFDRIATPAYSEHALASQSYHIAKLPSKVLSHADAFSEPSEIQMDLILANQHTLMANQCNLERRMDRIENLMLQILKALQKGKRQSVVLL